MPVNNSKSRRQQKRQDAEKRANAWGQLTNAEKLKRLDMTHGKGQGAGRQRARLASVNQSVGRSTREAQAAS